MLVISIHAPRAGSDRPAPWRARAKRIFQSTLPVRGATKAKSCVPPAICLFQSTLPVRGATVFQPKIRVMLIQFQSTLPVRGATLRLLAGQDRPRHFNPRSPCGERHKGHEHQSKTNAFQSTLPVRGATPDIPAPAFVHPISIHAPRAGSDRGLDTTTKTQEISIHAPRAGSDLIPVITAPTGTDFNPRSPCGERLVYNLPLDDLAEISIHAPRAGSDSA